MSDLLADKAGTLTGPTGLSQSSQSKCDMKQWLMSLEGLVLAVPSLFHDEDFKLTTYFVNNVLATTASDNGSSPVYTSDSIRDRYNELVAGGRRFVSKVRRPQL